MAHRVLSHTADTGVEATALTIGALIGELLHAMFGLMADIDRLAPVRWIATDVEADGPEDLVVDALSEALYLSEVEDLLLCSFEVSARSDGRRAGLRLGGVPMRSAPAVGPAIKAVTYHRLRVEKRDEWYGRVYLDV